jgi:L-lactate dehydrogenase complex protein LldG
MKESTSKEKVLKNIRNSLIIKTEKPYPNIDSEGTVFSGKKESKEIIFAEEFTKVQGKFVFCENETELLTGIKLLVTQKEMFGIYCKDNKFKNLLNKAGISFTSEEEDFQSMNAAITGCENIIARLGSIVVTSNQLPGRRIAGYAPVHIVVAYLSQLVYDLKDAISALRIKYKDNMPSMITIITGPSRTADIEKTLVMGAHGPKELYCFLIDDIN